MAARIESAPCAIYFWSQELLADHDKVRTKGENWCCVRIGYSYYYGVERVNADSH